MKKFFVLMLAMLWMSVAAFSLDYEKVNNHFVRTYTTVQVQLVN